MPPERFASRTLPCGTQTSSRAQSRLLALLLVTSACSGRIGGPGSAGGGEVTPVPDAKGNLVYAAPSPAPAGLPARVWRLTHVEYGRSVKELTGVDVDTSNFEAETDGGLFANISNVNFVRLQLATNYYDAAEQVADAIPEAQLRALAAPCGNLTATCKADFVKNVLTRAYRRPPSAEETSDAGGTFDLGIASGDVILPFRLVVQQVLTSPSFLYRTEIGPSAAMTQTSYRLTDHEVATLLSFSLLGHPPSAALLAAADRRELTNPTSLRTNVEALLATPEAAAPLRAFLFQWLTLNRINDDLYKTPTLYPGFDAVRGAMLDEANAFLTANGGMDGSITRLLTTPVPDATGALGDFYAAPGAGAGKRIGWLALGGFLSIAAHADQSSPTLRGNFVRERLLCQHMVLPPGVPALEEVEQMGATPTSTRELYQMHRKAECAVCHEALDQVGFTFEAFDGAGRFRTTELFRNQTSAVTVDTSGSLINTDVNRALADQGALAEALASSAWVRECAAIQAFRYTFGYGGDVSRGLPPVMAGYQALTSGGTMRSLLAAVMSSPSTFERIRN